MPSSRFPRDMQTSSSTQSVCRHGSSNLNTVRANSKLEGELKKGNKNEDLFLTGLGIENDPSSFWNHEEVLHASSHVAGCT